MSVGSAVYPGCDLRDLRVMEKLVEIREARLNFALDHHLNTRGERMEFNNYPHIKELYNSLAPHVVLQGSVQSLKSEWAILDHLAMAFAGLSVFFVLPKFESRNTFVQNRINRCVEQVSEYKKLIGIGFFDNIAIKSFGKGVVKYVGSNVLSDFKEFPADALVVEEVDECSQDNLAYGLDRCRASRYQFKRYLGNPRIKGRGINHHFENSDQREWNVPCLTCGRYSEMDWFSTIVDTITDSVGAVVSYNLRDDDWFVGCGRDIYMICPFCGGALDRTSNIGRWVPKEPLHPVEGRHISMLCSPINSIAGMWTRFQAAAADPTKLQHFYNSDLGLPYAAMGNKVTELLLDRCVDPDYELIVGDGKAVSPDDRHSGPCSMGIDVGGDIFDIRISCCAERGKRRAVFFGKIRGVEELLDLAVRYNVEKIVIDSMPEVLVVQEFQTTCSMVNIDCWLCRYGGEGTDRRLTHNAIHRVILIDRTTAMDHSFAQLKLRRNVLPKNYPAIFRGQFVREMCGPIRQVAEDARGNGKYEWTKCGDHQRHADTYDMLAADLMDETILDSVAIG